MSFGHLQNRVKIFTLNSTYEIYHQILKKATSAGQILIPSFSSNKISMILENSMKSSDMDQKLANSDGQICNTTSSVEITFGQQIDIWHN